MEPSTYSFLDVHCLLDGPGGSVNLGAGAANAKEGITFAALEPVGALVTGADGTPMHSLHASYAGKATVRILKTSPTNALLSNMLAYQRTSSLFWGQNMLSLANSITGDSYPCSSVAFAEVPSNTWAEDAGMIEWNFNIGFMNPNIGGGILSALGSL